MESSELLQIIKSTSELLDQYGSNLLSRGRLAYFQDSVRELSDKAGRDFECLYVGLVGGSGVGKSTLINAIARSKISDSSDRRPFTDKIVVYRHEDRNRGLEQLSDLFRSPDATHDNDALKVLIICDLPDIDSLETSNRGVVTKVLPHLDAIIWIVSPEKYADSSFYKLINASLIHQQNFIFVLNKMDQVFDDHIPDPYLRIKEILGDFGFRLKEEALVNDPKTFCLSSILEFQGNTQAGFLSNEFERFRVSLTLKWNEKQIQAVKQANLIEETRNLLFEMERDIDPEKKRKACELLEVEAQSYSDSIISKENLIPMENLLTERATRILALKDTSIRLVTLINNKLFLRNTRIEDSEIGGLRTILDSETATIAQQRFLKIEKIENDVRATLVLSTGEKSEKRPDSIIETISSKCAFQAFEIFKTRLENRIASWNRWISKIRTGFQSVMLFLPVIFFFLKLSGFNSISNLIENRILLSIADYSLRFLMSLFSLDGLVALLVLLIIESILIIFLAQRRLKKIERIARGISVKVTQNLMDCLNHSIKAEINERFSSIRQVKEGIVKFSEIVSVSARF